MSLQRLFYPLPLLTLVLALLLALPAPSRGQDAWNTYQDTDPRLLYQGGTWQTFQVAAALGGTLTATADPGATLTVYFAGTAVQLVYSLGPEGRTFSAQVDDGPLSTVYSYGDRYSHGQTLAFTDLSAGTHVLTVTNGEGALWSRPYRCKGHCWTDLRRPLRLPRRNQLLSALSRNSSSVSATISTAN